MDFEVLALECVDVLLRFASGIEIPAVFRGTAARQLGWTAELKLHYSKALKVQPSLVTVAAK